jgi:hypothetical protein
VENEYETEQGVLAGSDVEFRAETIYFLVLGSVKIRL